MTKTPIKMIVETTHTPTPATAKGVFGGTINYFVWRKVRVVRFRGPLSEGLETFEENTDDYTATISGRGCY